MPQEFQGTNQKAISHFDVMSFYDIFINNLLFGLTLIIVGYFTFSIGIFFLILWNGINFGILLNDIISINIATLTIIKLVVFHGIIELYAIILFSVIGCKGGISVLKALFSKENYPKLYFPTKSEILFPTILLLIASIIESIVSLTIK